MCEKLNFLKIQEEQGICPFKSVLFKNKQTNKKKMCAAKLPGHSDPFSPGTARWAPG